MRHSSNGSVRGGSASQRASATNSSIVSGQAHSDLRRREVVLAKISLYMVFVFLICHSVKIVPNIYEMLQTYLMVSFSSHLPLVTQSLYGVLSYLGR